MVKDSKASSPDLKEILKMLASSHFQLKSETLVSGDKILQRPVPDKVLTEVKIEGTWTLVPSSLAVGIVLRFNLTKKPTFDELKQIAELMLRGGKDSSRDGETATKG